MIIFKNIGKIGGNLRKYGVSPQSIYSKRGTYISHMNFQKVVSY